METTFNVDSKQIPMTVVLEGQQCTTISKELDIISLGNFEKVVSMPKPMILIMLISQEPAIFNPNHDDYRNTLKKDDMWMKIARHVGWSDINCKNKWKAMRDQFCRELKRSRTNPKAVIKWKYFQHLEFLRPYALFRNYRPKMPTRSQSEKQEQLNDPIQEGEEEKLEEDQQDQEEEEELIIKEDQLCSPVKTENWNIYNNSKPMRGSPDTPSEIMVQIAEPDNNEADGHQDDEDDDPIHTFLNIESYFEKELIVMIQAEEILYNDQHVAYRNVKLKLEVWEEIARKLKRTVRQCRLKWKALRDQYIREHKRLLFISHGKDIPRWKHYEALSFLEKHIKQKHENKYIAKKKLDNSTNVHLEQEQMITESTGEDHETTIGDHSSSEIFSNCRHIRRSDEEKQSEYVPRTKHIDPPHDQVSDTPTIKDDDDEVGAFFRAIAMKIRNAKMSAMALTELQIDILRVITKALRD